MCYLCRGNKQYRKATRWNVQASCATSKATPFENLSDRSRLRLTAIKWLSSVAGQAEIARDLDCGSTSIVASSNATPCHRSRLPSSSGRSTLDCWKKRGREAVVKASSTTFCQQTARKCWCRHGRFSASNPRPDVTAILFSSMHRITLREKHVAARGLSLSTKCGVHQAHAGELAAPASFAMPRHQEPRICLGDEAK